MKKFPWVIINRKERYEYERAMDTLRAGNKALHKEIDRLKEDMAKMARGERVCGKHCEFCQNACVETKISPWGNSTTTVCKLDAANTCGEFLPK